MFFCWICSYVLINPLAGLQLVSGWTTLSLEEKQDIQKERSQFCIGLETSMSWEPWFLPLLCSKPRLPIGEPGISIQVRGDPASSSSNIYPPSFIPSEPARKSCMPLGESQLLKSIPCLGPHHPAHGDLISLLNESALSSPRSPGSGTSA